MERQIMARTHSLGLAWSRGGRLGRTGLSRGAFTLIELLVVVAILALLVAILVPSLRNARKLAVRAICSSNLHNTGVAMGAYASEFNGSITWNPFVGPPASTGWGYYTYVVQSYRSTGLPADFPLIWNMGWWVSMGYMPGKLLHCPGTTIVAPTCYMSPTTLQYKIIDAWTSDRPRNINTGAFHNEWLYATYAFNAGLTASTWYTSKPWTKTTTYAGAMAPWKLEKMDPAWPVVADLRTYPNIGNGHPAAYYGSHHCEGFQVQYAAGDVRWIDLNLPPDLSDTGLYTYTSPTYNGASLSSLWDNEFLRR